MGPPPTLPARRTRHSSARRQLQPAALVVMAALGAPTLPAQGETTLSGEYAVELQVRDRWLDGEWVVVMADGWVT